MFSLRPSRWLYGVYLTPALLGLRFAFVYQDPTYNLIGAFMAASSFVMIGENAWSVAKRESEPTVGLLSEAELRERGQAAWDAKNQTNERKIPNLAPDNGYSFMTTSLNLVQKDERWQQFGFAVASENTPMTQAKWTGKGRPFSKTEFVKQIAKWEKDNIVKQINPKNRNDGFTPKGKGGREYFFALGRGDKWIALPYSNSD